MGEVVDVSEKLVLGDVDERVADPGQCQFMF